MSEVCTHCHALVAAIMFLPVLTHSVCSAFVLPVVLTLLEMSLAAEKVTGEVIALFVVVAVMT